MTRKLTASAFSTSSRRSCLHTRIPIRTWLGGQRAPQTSEGRSNKQTGPIALDGGGPMVGGGGGSMGAGLWADGDGE
eukprot:594787-Rhodomonas_salina.1